jgi:23S rRNA pseudouridine2605 synthase
MPKPGGRGKGRAGGGAASGRAAGSGGRGGGKGSGKGGGKGGGKAPAQPDPMRTAVGYIGADAALGRGKPGRGRRGR